MKINQSTHHICKHIAKAAQANTPREIVLKNLPTLKK